MDRFIVIHYNELGLKKGNRDYFENRLCLNINNVLENCGAERARRISGRILVRVGPDTEINEIAIMASEYAGTLLALVRSS